MQEEKKIVFACAKTKRRKKEGKAECLTPIALVMGLFAVYKKFSEINVFAKKSLQKYSIIIALIALSRKIKEI